MVMPSRAPQHHLRPTWNRRAKRSLAILLTGLCLWLLTQVPYDIIRQERIRAFGEDHAEATIRTISTENESGQRQYFITYAYQGPDGRIRQRKAPFPQEIWAQAAVGQRMTIYFSKGEPNLSRAQGEVENEFRVWLRNTVRGNDLPEFSGQK